MTRRCPITAPLVLIAAGTLLFAACGDAGPKVQTVEVDLDEWQVTPRPTSAEEGTLRFVVTNRGQRFHELEVVQGDAVMAEVEDIAPGDTKTFEISLDGGSYTLACRIREETDEGIIDHLAAGMSADFPVDFVVGRERAPARPGAEPDPEPDPVADPLAE